MGATLLGLQATVGVLVAKALTSSGTPYLQGAPQGYSPVLALDVFLVQVSIGRQIILQVTHSLVPFRSTIVCSISVVIYLVNFILSIGENGERAEVGSESCQVASSLILYLVCRP